MKEILLEIRELVIGHGNDVLYDKVCLDICEGDCIMLCGANGSGKTTFLKQIAQMGKDITMIPSRIPKVPGFTLKDFIRQQTDRSTGGCHIGSHGQDGAGISCRPRHFHLKRW